MLEVSRVLFVCPLRNHVCNKQYNIKTNTADVVNKTCWLHGEVSFLSILSFQLQHSKHFPLAIMLLLKIILFVPFSTYQVIVLKDEANAENLKNVSKENLNLNIAAEINNNPVREASWEFTIGDKRKYGAYVNEELERGQEYIVYQRAVTRLKNVSKCPERVIPMVRENQLVEIIRSQ